MRKFLKKIFYFFIGLIFLNLLFYFLVFKPAFFDKYIFNINSISKYNMFLISDSHGAFIAESPSKNHIFNFSNTSENYLDMYLKIQYLTSILSTNDTILLSIDNHSLSSYRNGFGRIEENIIYANDISMIEEAAIQPNFYLKNFTKYLPLLEPNYNKSILKYLEHRFFGSKNITTFSKLSNDQKEIACKKRYNKQFKNQTFSAQQKDYLEKIIQLCKEKNVTLIGVRFPITKEYWNLIKDNDFGIKEIWLSHDLDIIDLHDLFFEKNEFFYDEDHLNIKGGELFSEAIIESLKNL